MSIVQIEVLIWMKINMLPQPVWFIEAHAAFILHK